MTTLYANNLSLSGTLTSGGNIVVNDRDIFSAGLTINSINAQQYATAAISIYDNGQANAADDGDDTALIDVVPNVSAGGYGAATAAGDNLILFGNVG